MSVGLVECCESGWRNMYFCGSANDTVLNQTRTMIANNKLYTIWRKCIGSAIFSFNRSNPSGSTFIANEIWFSFSQFPLFFGFYQLQMDKYILPRTYIKSRQNHLQLINYFEFLGSKSFTCMIEKCQSEKNQFFFP